MFVASAEGQTALNGWWQITVFDPTSYTLIGSAYAGGYAAGTGRAAGPAQIARCWWALAGASGWWSFRDNMHGPSTNEAQYYSSCVNQFAHSGNAGNNIYPVSLVVPHAVGSYFANFGGFYDLIEARLVLRPANQSAGFRCVGELWNAFLVTTGTPIDTFKNAFDGYNWVQYSADPNLALWLVVSAAA